MPFEVTRGPAVIIEKEILRGAGGLDDIKSMVVDSTKVIEWPTSSGRYIIEAGTVMVKVPSSSKIAAINGTATGSGSAGAFVAADIVGIAAVTKEFYIGVGVTAGNATDEPIAILHMGCHFNASKLVGYSGRETVVAAALPLCKFD